MNKQEIYEFLNKSGVEYETVEHRAVYNMAENAELKLPHPEAEAKNLFIRDHKKRQYFLLTVKGTKRVDLKAFSKANSTPSLTFASAEEMLSILSLTPGSVTPFGLLNDAEKKVTFYMDKDLCGSLIGCHPNENTATVFLKADDLLSILKDHGSKVFTVDM